jgi:hypothetical protein
MKDTGVAEDIDDGGRDRPCAIDHVALLADHLRQRAHRRHGIRRLLGRDRMRASWLAADLFYVALRTHGWPLGSWVPNLARRRRANMSELP